MPGHALPNLSGLPDLGLLASGRVHEAAGAARRVFAAVLAGRLAGPVLWLQEGREADRLCPQGLMPFLDPARLVLARAPGTRAVLQLAEEALCSGAVALVVAELPEPADLTAGRRLQLAAGAGGGRGLCLVPEGRARGNASETRWLCTPIPGGRARQLWELVKNRRGKLGVWEVNWAPQAPLPGTHPAPATGGRDPASVCA